MRKSSAGYGIPHPERVLGFAGTYLFCLGDIYVSDGVEKLLDLHIVSDDMLRELLNKVHKEEYGHISNAEMDNNTEQRYLAGTHRGIAARYDVGGNRIVFAGLWNACLLYIEGENIHHARAILDADALA